MAIKYKESLDEIIASKVKQSAAETAATMTRKYLLDEGSLLEINENRTTDQGEKSGYESPTRLDLGVRDLSGTLSMAKARPDFLAWLAAMFCNNHSEAAAGSTGYLHTSYIHSSQGATGNIETEPAYFTLAHKKGSTADFRRFTGCSLNTLRLLARIGEPLGASSDVLGIGKTDDQVYQEVIAGTKASTTLVLAKGVHGESIDNVSVTCDYDVDGFYEKVVTCVSIVNATKTLTITAPGSGADAINFLVTYRVINTETGYTWADTATGVSSTTEFSVQTKNTKLVLFGSPTNSAYTLGQTAGVEIEDVEIGLNWNQRVIKAWRSGATISNNATAIQNGVLAGTIKVSRQTKDLLLRKFWTRGETAGYQFSLYVECLGPEYESGQAWQFNVILPRVALLSMPMRTSNGLWVEEGNLVLMKDTGAGDLRDVIFQTRNQVSGYLA